MCVCVFVRDKFVRFLAVWKFYKENFDMKKLFVESDV